MIITTVMTIMIIMNMHTMNHRQTRLLLLWKKTHHRPRVKLLDRLEKHHLESSFSTRIHLGFIYGLSAVVIVSALSLVGLLALPFLYKVSFEYVLKLFTAIAIGTLFGDAMFHLIPIVSVSQNGDHG